MDRALRPDVEPPSPQVRPELGGARLHDPGILGGHQHERPVQVDGDRRQHRPVEAQPGPDALVLAHDEGGRRRAFRPAEHADAPRIENAGQAGRQRPGVRRFGVAPGGEVVDAVGHGADVRGELPRPQGGFIERDHEPAVGELAERVVRVIHRDHRIPVAGKLPHHDGGVRTVIVRAVREHDAGQSSAHARHRCALVTAVSGAGAASAGKPCDSSSARTTAGDAQRARGIRSTPWAAGAVGRNLLLPRMRREGFAVPVSEPAKHREPRSGRGPDRGSSVGRVGLEPTTNGLKVHCSAN